MRIGAGKIAGCQPLSAALLSCIYALPALPEVSTRNTLERLIEGDPWAESFTAAPEQTAAAVNAIFADLMLEGYLMR